MGLKLTDGERITIGRRRAGYTQISFAAMHGVKQVQVSRWESGRLPAPPDIQSQYAKLGRLAQHELIMLYRKRNKLFIHEAASMRGVSRYQWVKIEAGDVKDNRALEDIREYYEQWQEGQV